MWSPASGVVFHTDQAVGAGSLQGPCVGPGSWSCELSWILWTGDKKDSINLDRSSEKSGFKLHRQLKARF